MLQTYHVTATAGVNRYFGDDQTTGWPIGPVALAQNQTFFYDPHGPTVDRLQTSYQSTLNLIATGAGSIAATTAANLGVQNKWWATGSGLPGHENTY